MKTIHKRMVLSPLVMMLASCSFLAAVPAVTPAPTGIVATISTSMPEPISPPTTTPIPQYTKTAKPSTVIETQEGKLFISHEYGFSILLPHDSDSVVYNRADYLPAVLIALLPQISLEDGGEIIPWLHSVVEEPIDNCHPWAPSYPAVPVTVEHVSLGGTSYNKVYTTDLDQDDIQYIDYMTYGANFCVHFWINLTTYYFDGRVDAQPPRDMLPYIQDELDRMVSTFQWVKP